MDDSRLLYSIVLYSQIDDILLAWDSYLTSKTNNYQLLNYLVETRNKRRKNLTKNPSISLKSNIIMTELNEISQELIDIFSGLYDGLIDVLEDDFYETGLTKEKFHLQLKESLDYFKTVKIRIEKLDLE